MAATSLTGSDGESINAATTTAGAATMMLGITQLVTNRNVMRRDEHAKEAARITREISQTGKIPTNADVETWRTRRIQLHARM